MPSELTRSVCLLLAVVLSGCGGVSDSRPPVMPVKGTVLLDGKPLSGAMISFIPIGETRGAGGGARTDTAGRYELTSAHGDKGAPLGQYKVIVSKSVMPDGSDYHVESMPPPIQSTVRQILPSKYTNPSSTVLKATIRDGVNTIDLPLSVR